MAHSASRSGVALTCRARLAMAFAQTRFETSEEDEVRKTSGAVAAMNDNNMPQSPADEIAVVGPGWKNGSAGAEQKILWDDGR
jgi:hypothetical protein